MINKVILIGNLGQNVEFKNLESGVAVAKLSLATSETWKTENGEKKERTEWHRVILWRKLAELANQYLQKGSKVYIEGKLQPRKHEDEGGVTRYYTEVVAKEMKFLSKREMPGTFPSVDDAPPAKSKQASNEVQSNNNNSSPDDDLPF